MNCNHCGAENREGAKFCTECGDSLVPNPEVQSIDLGPYHSVYQQYQKLKYGEPADRAASPEDSEYSPLAAFAGYDATYGIKGSERSVGWSLLLSLATCGIYGFVWLYKIGSDLRRLAQKDDPRAGLDVLLTFLTCNVWGIYLAYKYPRLIDERQRKTGLPESRLSIVCLLLTTFSVWKVYGLGLLSLALMQNEINKIWRKQGETSP